MTTQHGFELVREERIAELNTTARVYRHVKTGAQLLSMLNDDENKVFGISFFTPPPDSTGLPHIMEHSVLCGSRKYPLKEPFVELIKGSLKTFVNAFTFSDKTCYPVASQNVQDFHNLIDVYLDAVFYPRITPETLMQEGWHYELDSLDAPLIYKGVVFNEMKGAYSSPDNVMGRLIESSVLPDTPYGVDSGGDPKEIPNLTYENFKRFHDTYYHPSNSLIWFYGDDDPDERLRILDGYLRDFESIPAPEAITLQPRFDDPTRLVYDYDAGEEDGDSAKGMVAVSWLLTDALDTEMTLALNILGYILIGTPASPLRKALIDSGLGEDLAGPGLADDQRQLYFSTGLKGIAVEDADKVEALILETLERLSTEGIAPDTVEAALNTVEFRLRENNTGSFPRGIALMIRALSSWLYGGDPIARMRFEAPLNAIKQRFADGERFFERLISEQLLHNMHRTTLLMKPNPEKRARDEAEERDRLAQVHDSMSQDELQQVIDNTQRLKLMQETPDSPEALASIPSLTLADLDKTIRTIPVSISEEQGAKVLFHDLFTNGIAYLDFGFDLHQLPQDVLPYLSLFTTLLTQIGTEDEDFVKLSQRIGRKTGGVRASTFTSAMRNADGSAAWLFIRGKGTMPQTDDLLAIIRDILLTIKLDNKERFRQIVLEEKAGYESALVPSGHSFANTRLRSHFTEADWLGEQLGGLSQLFFLRELEDKIDSDWSSCLAKLESIRRALLNRKGMIVNVTLDEANWNELQPKVAEFLTSLPSDGTTHQTWTPDFTPANEAFTIPAKVNYVAKGANLYDLGYEPDGSATVINNYLRTTWLWEKVRVQGGAYGGFCIFDTRTGVYSYLSYRDPNLLSTLENYDKTANFLHALELDDAELVKSIIGVIGSLDAYQLPDAKGFTSMVYYLTGETDEFRQSLRDQVLSTSAADFQAFSEVLMRLSENGIVVVLGSQEAIDTANEARGGWLTVQKAL